MHAGDFDALHALDKKALDLGLKTHYARAAVKRDAAVLAAKALGYADCLITTTMELEAAMMWFSHAVAPGVLDADCDAAMEHALQYVRHAHEVLERRRAAGTLQPYKCRYAEEEWSATRPLFNDAYHKRQAPFTGYHAYLFAATHDLSSYGVDAWHRSSCPAQDATELESFVVSAVDMMLQPREKILGAFRCEIAFAQALQVMYNRISCRDTEPRFPALLDACHRLERSGVLRERNLITLCSSHERIGTELMATADANYASAVLHTCALETCSAREVHESQFKRCGACRSVVYCCREHQVEDWPAHKAACKAARKAVQSGTS